MSINVNKYLINVSGFAITANLPLDNPETMQPILDADGAPVIREHYFTGLAKMKQYGNAIVIVWDADVNHAFLFETESEAKGVIESVKGLELTNTKFIKDRRSYSLLKSIK